MISDASFPVINSIAVNTNNRVESGITLIQPSTHQLPFSNAWLLAAIYLIASSNSKNIISSWACYVFHVSRWTRNTAPASNSIHRTCIDSIASADTIDVVMSCINLLQTSIGTNPVSKARLLALVNVIVSINTPYVAVSWSWNMLHASRQTLPVTTSICGTFENLVMSIHAPHLFVTDINLHEGPGHMSPASSAWPSTPEDLMSAINSPNVVDWDGCMPDTSWDSSPLSIWGCDSNAQQQNDQKLHSWFSMCSLEV